VTLQVQPVNDAPISLEKLFSVFQGSTLTTVTGVLTSDIDKDNDPLIAILVSPPTRGLISFRRDGTFVYEPEIGFIGVDRFTYVASDGVTSGQPTTVEVKVEVGSVILPAITPFSDSSSSASSLSGDWAAMRQAQAASRVTLVRGTRTILDQLATQLPRTQHRRLLTLVALEPHPWSDRCNLLVPEQPNSRSATG